MYRANLSDFKQKALQWACKFDAVCYLDSNNFSDTYSKFDTLIAIGAKQEIVANSGNAFEQLSKFREANPDWITGFLGYDLKNELENLTSNNTDQLKSYLTAYPGNDYIRNMVSTYAMRYPDRMLVFA